MIDPQAIVHRTAQIAADVTVGPWTYIGENVSIDSGTIIGSHVVIKGPTTIGKNNKIFQFATVGEECQDRKYQGEPTRLEIGDNNIIREGCTIHRGTIQDQGLTKIGSNNLLMAYVHIAHDCVIGNNIVMANNAAVAGHVIVEDWAILGGFVIVHQYSHIGAYCMCGGGSVISKDIPAFVIVSGNPAKVHGLNFEGMRRHQLSNETMSLLKRAYKIVYRDGLTIQEALPKLEELAQESPEVKIFLASIQQASRGITR